MAETMEAGRELDALIAEEVMGWRRSQDPAELGAATLGEAATAWCISVAGDLMVARRANAGRWHPSTDIAAAWEVVERMREHPEAKFCSLRMVAYSYNRTYATFDMTMTYEDDWTEANGEHATPLAICLAALDAYRRGERRKGGEE